MAIVSSQLTAGTSTNASTLHVTSTFTPSSGRLILAAVGTTANAAITLEGNGATWVVERAVLAGPNARITVFRAMSTGALLSGASTIRFAGLVPIGPVEWSITQFSGVSTDSTDGAGAIVQSLGAQGTTANSSVAVNLAAFAAPGNQGYGAFAQNSTTLFTTGNGFSPLASTFGQRDLGGFSALLAEEKTTDNTIEAFGTATAVKVVVGIEIKESTVSEARISRLLVGTGR